MDYEQTLKAVTAYGFTGSRIEHTGGGIMVVSIPLPNTPYEVAWLNDYGCGVYLEEWADQEEHFFNFEDEPSTEDVLKALEWLEGIAKGGN